MIALRWRRAFAVSITACFLLAAAACGDRRVDDSELGTLVVGVLPEAAPIDVDAAAKDVGELRRALATPHSAISLALASHRVKATSSVVVTSGGQVVTDLADETTIEIDGDGNFAARADNNHDYGRHAIYKADILYLRPRFGIYHRREPANASEPGSIRDELFETSSAYFELLYGGVELSDRGAVTFAGRPARKIEFKTSTSPSQRDEETLSHKKWRESISVKSAAGTITLDDATGFPLEAEIAGTITFTKGTGENSFSMDLKARHTIADIGSAISIEAPPAEETVATPTVSSEVDEQRKLLEGLAPAGGVGDSND